jgi:hypothetical protein
VAPRGAPIANWCPMAREPSRAEPSPSGAEPSRAPRRKPETSSGLRSDTESRPRRHRARSWMCCPMLGSKADMTPNGGRLLVRFPARIWAPSNQMPDSRDLWGRWDSNPHWQEPKSCASAVGLRPPVLPYRVLLDRQNRQTPSSLRSRATWPVALTAYCACSIVPPGPTTNVDLITPTDFLPYSIFSP